jgi:acetylornithine deacetylase/succinyl-diaminopimelate desuccinylase-like protein
MSQNLISLTLSSADETALDEALATLERIFAPFITLTPAQARALLKMGDKSEVFCHQTELVLRQNPGMVPGDFSLEEYRLDLAALDALRPRLGDVGLVICLDSGAGNYDQLWLTTSLRGMASGTLKVEILTEGIHSGDASGLVPSSFRIMRQVLDRLEDSKTGRLLPQSFHCQVPADRLAQAQATAAILGEDVYRRFPWAHYDCGGSTTFALPTTTDPVQALLKRTWEPTLSVTGAEGFPTLQDAGNVLRPYTAFKLSLRLPPLVDAAQAVQELKALLEDNAPYQARVTFEGGGATGWNAPATTPWFERALNEASQAHFGAPCGYIGQGGTIPLMNMLSEGFPTAQMMVCGVLGPKSNAHGPNEFLHVPYAKRLTASVAHVMAAMAQAQAAPQGAAPAAAP